ncbi:MAG: glycosyltransferase family 4 protein [Thiohalorhabdaceae bacterium]
MRIAIITDAWHPQINGVVTTLGYTRRELEALGNEVRMVTPEDSRTVGLPTYPDIRLSLRPGRKVRRALDAFRPEAIHIVTEGPLGLAARRYCLRRGLPFTTSFHTRFPEYVQLRLPFVPLEWGYAFLRWFHGAAERTMVTNEPLRRELAEWGLTNLVHWPRGVDTERFRPRPKGHLGVKRPVFLYLGRVAVEKSVEDFLALDLPGTKVVVGDGPARQRLEAAHPEAVFLGFRTGEALVQALADADVFVFPSRTDSLGLVLYEALACGVPIAAYPVTGPSNVVDHGVTGYLDEDLGQAARAALTLDPEDCRRAAEGTSWRECTEAFLAQLAPVQSGLRPVPAPSED